MSTGVEPPSVERILRDAVARLTSSSSLSKVPRPSGKRPGTRPDYQRVNFGEHALGSFVPPSGVDHFWRAHLGQFWRASKSRHASTSSGRTLLRCVQQRSHLRLTTYIGELAHTVRVADFDEPIFLANLLNEGCTVVPVLERVEVSRHRADVALATRGAAGIERLTRALRRAAGTRPCVALKSQN
jgi:hypothetical protein